MADAAHGWLLEVRRGTSGTDHLAFPRGQPMQPISLGLRGQWRIEADGVLDVHGYVYFDGQNLFVQSASVDSPLRVNGQAMGPQWAPVGAPCTIALGDARLVFHDAAEGITRAPNVRPAAGLGLPSAFGPGAEFDATSVQHPAVDEELDGETRALPVANFGSFGPPAARPPPGPPMPQYTQRAVAPRTPDERTGDIALPPSFRERDDEPTKAIPIPPEVPEAPLPPPGMPPPAFSQMQHTPQPMIAAPNAQIQPHDPTPRTNPLATIKVQRPNDGSLAEKIKPIVAKLGEDWRATSLPKKAILALLPVAFIMVIVAFGDKEQPAPTKTRPKGTSAAQTTSATSSKSKSTPTTAQSPSTSPSTSPSIADTDTPPPQPTPSVAPSASANAGDKTLERAAVDAVVSGDFAQAAKLYTQLAAQHADNPAYAEAAKILRRKASQK